METTNQKITTENKKLMMGALALVIAGLAFIFLIPLGSLTDNRFGTHLVLSSDLSTAGEQGWFTVLTMVTGLAFVGAGIKLAVFNNLNIININENQDRTFKMGATLLVGSAAFILALSSISFAAFNSQYFESQIKNGTSDQAWAWIALTWISVAAVIIFIALGYFGIIRLEKNNVYLTLRNSSVALVALGWFVFNLCINSFGAMGGDAAVLVENLTGISLYNIGGKFVGAGGMGDALTAASDMTAEQFYKEVLLANDDGLPGWVVASGPFTKFWEEGTSITLKPILPPLLYDTVVSFGGLQNLLHAGGVLLSGPVGDIIVDIGGYLQSFDKQGPIMGVNNSMNSLLIFISLLGAGVIGIPLYGVLVGAEYDENKTSVMYVGSLVLIVIMALIYLFLALTPYMAATESYSILETLLLGKFGGFCPGLIAQAGNEGGIHSAIVYFSPQYGGTITWWIAEVLTFVSLVASFVGSWLVIKTLNNKSETKE